MTLRNQVDARGSAPTVDRPRPADTPAPPFSDANGAMENGAYRSADRVQAVFEPLWAGRADHLGSAGARAVAPLSGDVSAADRPAVLAALRTPDICLIETPDPDSAARVAAGVVAAAAGAGENVVVHAFTADAARRLEVASAGLATRPAPPAKRLWWIPTTWWSRPIPNGRVPIVVPPAATSAGACDCVVVLDSHRFQRPSLLEAAALGRRWVLVGSVAANPDSAFAGLWSTLDRGPWVREGDRLCCRLCAVEPQHRHRLTAEPLADAPDIELRIDQPPGEDPRLAEVVFPAGTTLAAAKEFIGRTLDEWPIDIDPAALAWTETDASVRACLGCSERHAPLAAEITPGVRELLAERPGQPVPWFTCGFTFDRAAGWDRPRAEAWLLERLAGRPLGRAVSVVM
jgi:hypothetical protein